MTRFGRWFTIGLVAVIGLFVVLLLMPGGKAPPERTVAPPPQLAAVPAGPAAAVVASGLVMPVAGVSPASLTDTFGDPRGEGGTRGHRALDIMAPRGTPVLAAADGRIEKIFESELGGHTIYIRSPNGRNMYYYAHLDSYAPVAREGAAVRAGTRIGSVGATGDASPEAPHLHFEIKRMQPGQPWHEGAAINPYPLLANKPALAGGRAGG